MKLALAGGYGHCNAMISGAAECEDVEFVAAARWGDQDPMKYTNLGDIVPKDLRIYDDYRKMLDEVEPDIVGVFMPLYRIGETATEAVRRRCHVVCEKPLATTLEDLQVLREAVEQNHVQLAAYMSMRAQPAFLATRRIVQSGAIGRPILAAAQKSYPFKQRDDFYKKRRTYGGSIPWQAIHALDFIGYCSGKDYARVAAMHSNAAHPTHPGMEDNGGILLELTGGGHAVIWFDYLRPWADGVERRHGDDRLRIAGSEGVVEIVEEGTAVRLMTPTSVEPVPLPPAANLFATFVQSIGKTGQCLISTDESFRVTEVALKARQAADTGQAVDL